MPTIIVIRQEVCSLKSIKLAEANGGRDTNEKVEKDCLSFLMLLRRTLLLSAESVINLCALGSASLFQAASAPELGPIG
jgi:hypothetical protein